jgi:hypothetical protein
VEHSKVSHDGTSHHARQQRRAERGLARHEEQDRAQHFEQTGDVSEPLADANCLESAIMSTVPSSFPDPAATNVKATSTCSVQSAMFAAFPGVAPTSSALRMVVMIRGPCVRFRSLSASPTPCKESA